MPERTSPHTPTCHHLEPLEGRAMLAGDLAITAVTSEISFSNQIQIRLVSSTVTVQNVGDEAVRGTLGVDFFLSTDATIGDNDYRLTLKGLPKVIGAGRSVRVSIREDIPLDLIGVRRAGVILTPGDYRLLARINLAGGAVDATTTNNTGEAPGTVPISYEFGDIGQHKTLMLKTFTSTFGFATFKLWGGGHGELISSNGSLTVRLTGTTPTTKLAIDTPNRFINVTLDGLTVEGPIGSIIAEQVDIDGDLTIEGGVKVLKLRDISGSAWSIGGSGGTSRLSIRNATNVSLSSSQAISALSATSWTTFDGGDDVIVAPQIASLSISGSLDPDLSIGGSGRPGSSLSKAVIGGGASGRWDILGDVGSIKLGVASGGFAANITGDLRLFSVTTNMTGTLAARNITNFAVGGALTSSAIVAGANLGSDIALGGTGASVDIFGPGRIGSIRVGGAMNNSLLAAGLDPVDNNLLNGDDRFVDNRSSLGLIIIGGDSTGSSFAAPVLRDRVQINGRSIKTYEDPRFISSLP